MSDHTIPQTQIDLFVTQMTERFSALARTLGSWVASEPHSLGELEQQVLRTIKDLGATLLAGLAQLLAPRYPVAKLPCDCGKAACFIRNRAATIKTVLGTITLKRPYYLCRACHQGFSPFDQQLGLCAGGISAGLDELLALLGTTQNSFAQATTVLEKLTLVSVCPNSVREATEHLGQLLHTHEQQIVEQLQTSPDTPALRRQCGSRLYISMDGVLVHLREEGWKELKLGSVYTTSSRVPLKRPEQVEVRAVAHSFVADLSDAASFGPRLWAEAAQRGVMQAAEVVVVGDGAHWIWKLADEYFPQAVQILDWYHASQYVWAAAHAVYGEGDTLATSWARSQLDRLWEGQVEQVISALQSHLSAGETVARCLTYFREQQERMHYDEYRERGLQIGSGTIESGCKAVIGARLKQAGMIWEREGAVAVATVRAWQRSGRWEEAIGLRVAHQRSYIRRESEQEASAAFEGQVRLAQAQVQLDQARLERSEESGSSATVGRQQTREGRAGSHSADTPEQALASRPQAVHPWKRAWSIRRQRELAAAQHSQPPAALSA